MKIISTLLFALFVSNALAQATQNKPSQQGGEHRGPPPEALAACKGAKAEKACNFIGGQGETVKGTCWAPDSSKPLACKPAGRPPMQGESKTTK